MAARAIFVANICLNDSIRGLAVSILMSEVGRKSFELCTRCSCLEFLHENNGAENSGTCSTRMRMLFSHAGERQGDESDAASAVDFLSLCHAIAIAHDSIHTRRFLCDCGDRDHVSQYHFSWR